MGNKAFRTIHGTLMVVPSLRESKAGNDFCTFVIRPKDSIDGLGCLAYGDIAKQVAALAINAGQPIAVYGWIKPDGNMTVEGLVSEAGKTELPRDANQQRALHEWEAAQRRAGKTKVYVGERARWIDVADCVFVGGGYLPRLEWFMDILGAKEVTQRYREFIARGSISIPKGPGRAINFDQDGYTKFLGELTADALLRDKRAVRDRKEIPADNQKLLPQPAVFKMSNRAEAGLLGVQNAQGGIDWDGVVGTQSTKPLDDFLSDLDDIEI